MGVAACHDNKGLGVLPTKSTGQVPGLLVRILGDAARIDNVDGGLTWVGDELIARVLELVLDGMGIKGVYLASQCFYVDFFQFDRALWPINPAKC